MGKSILDDLGQEVTGIVSPVTICMALTVLLVRVLNPNGVSNSNAVAIAQAYYKEQDSDPTSVKFEGALINSLIFVVIVGIMTFILFLLFKYGCESCIWGYMAFAAFNILFIVLGLVALQLVLLQPLPIDAFSFLFILWNFSVVGTATMFMWPAPVVMKQGYMIVVGIVMAFLFTSIPEWTTWILLIAMAVYDIVAVLMPNGPLKLLVELAQERDAQIPALVYEARSTGHGRGRRQPRSATEAVAALPVSTVTMAGGSNTRNRGPHQEEIELTDSSQDTPTQGSHASSGGLTEDAPGKAVVHERIGGAAGVGFVEEDRTHIVPRGESQQSDVEDQEEQQDVALLPPETMDERHARRQGYTPQQNSDISQHNTREQDFRRAGGGREEEEEEDMGLPDGIKLGLGDFIFYSVLVGRAAMYDWLTVFACYLAIVAGLGATLLCLALYQAALPALPISITMGVVFYFLARWVLEPFLLPMSMHLLYF